MEPGGELNIYDEDNATEEEKARTRKEHEEVMKEGEQIRLDQAEREKISELSDEDFEWLEKTVKREREKRNKEK